MKIAIASDHAGYELKRQLKEFFVKISFIDVGTFSEESVDYPDYAHKAIEQYNQGNCEKVILICGSGNGIQMTANKYKNIRCGLCWDPEIAQLARSHNNVNVIAMPARYISFNTAKEIVQTFLETPFEGGRHQKRIDKINYD
ncbi:MAG: ribose 5-phosphate isomerase B [Crocinitomicaceae bacterium]|jgi:ribose 5-phosphate isomerase B|nr:ribose 5-phosphate isomerase B [Crocinitomicaceae bacterium]|tara:strand:+ start:5253 stop:5678 length:426 start_codon:yes stop_codon:yes gene_type:complete